MAPLNGDLPPTLKHFSHEHLLQFLQIPKEFICHGCNTQGFGPRFHCPTCRYVLHEYCATCPRTLSSPLHPVHSLELVKRSGGDRKCDICEELVHGLFYTCEACGFDVHPLCTQLTVCIQIPLHPGHALKFQSGIPADCARCAETCTNWRFRCDTCNFNIHLKCSDGESDEKQNDHKKTDEQTSDDKNRRVKKRDVVYLLGKYAFLAINFLLLRRRSYTRISLTEHIF